MEAQIYMLLGYYKYRISKKIQELPVISKDFKLDLKDLLSKWRRDLNDNNHLINIYGENFDNAEK